MNIKKQYRVKKTNIIEALEEIDAFLEKIELFTKKYPEYSYEFKITKTKKYWEILLTLIKNE